MPNYLQHRRGLRSSCSKALKRCLLLCALILAVLSAASGACQQIDDPLSKARSYISSSKFGEAEGVVRGYLADHPTSGEGHFLLGYVLFRTKRATESLAELTAGARYRRPPADVLKIVASNYVLLSDFGDADKWFSEVLLEKPDDDEAWYLLGRTQYYENRFSDAISSFEHALALHPRFIEAENNVGLCWKELNSMEKAQTAFETAVEWQSGDSLDAQPFLNLGSLLADENQLERAAWYLARAAQLSPENPTIHERLGKVYLAQKDLLKAQNELERAVALAPNASGPHFSLGQIYRREGLVREAQRELAICAKLNSTHSSTETPNPPSIDENPK